MKKILALTIALLGLTVGPAPAQEWKEALKRAATSAADKLTEGKLTQYALIGTWDYTAPGVKFESDDTLSDLGGAALSGSVGKQLERAYRMAGIEPGAGTFAFAADGTFAAELGKHKLGGTYDYDAATPTSAARSCSWSSRSPGWWSSSKASAAAFRRWPPSPACSSSTTTYTWDSSSTGAQTDPSRRAGTRRRTRSRAESSRRRTAGDPDSVRQSGVRSAARTAPQEGFRSGRAEMSIKF